MRFFDEDKQMNNQELDNYFLNKRKDYSMWEKENSMIDIDDIDTDLLKKEIDKGYEKKEFLLNIVITLMLLKIWIIKR